MRPALAYAPGPQPPAPRLRPALAVAFLGAFAVVAFAFSNPLVLLADGIAVAIAGFAAGGAPRGARLAAAWRCRCWC